MSRSLLVGFCVLTIAAAASPFIVRWAAGYWNGPVISFALAMSLPVIACVGWTLVQQRRSDVKTTSFAAGPLAAASVLLAAAAFAVSLLGWVGAAIDFLLVPIAGVYLAIAWVQPRDGDTLPTVLVTLALCPLVAWFAGRADEYVREGVISAGFMVVCVALLALLRRRATFA